MSRLLTSIDEINNYLVLDPNIEIERLNPFIDKAQISFIKPLLGALYDTLLADYTSNNGDTGAMDNDLAELLPYVQRSLAYHLMFLGLTQLSVHVGNIGVTTERGESQDPVPKWRNDELRIDFLKSGDQHAEELLSFLEENASPSKYNDWYTDDSVNTIAGGLICRSATIAMKHIDIEAAPRRIYLRMKKRIRKIEREYIHMLVCTDQYEQLVSNIKTDNITSANQSLIEKLEPIIAKMALYQTIPTMQMHLSENGLTIYSSSDGVVSRQAASTQQVNLYLGELKIGDFGYEKDIDILKQFIEDNIDTYPLIKASPCYTSLPEAPNKTHRITNSQTSRFFAT